MGKRLLLIGLAVGLTISFSACSSKEEKLSETKEVEYLPEGAIVGYEDYKGYKVPLLSDGKGGHVRWMADVPWALLPIEMRMKFASTGGGLLSPEDLGEIWLKFGEWKKAGEYYQLRIGTPEGE